MTKQRTLNVSLQHKQLLGGILLATFLVYFQTFSFDFVNWDDDYYVINNLQVTNPTLSNLLSFFKEGNTANYHPITMLSLTLNYALGGESATGFHIINLLFHLLNVIVLYRWTMNLWPQKTFLAFWVAGVFALHPMHVESVAWISSRKDVLFFFFYFLGLIEYIKYNKSLSKKHLVFTLAFFILSGLSKPTAVIFPIHLLLIDYVQNRAINIRSLLEKIPFFVISILIGLATVLVQTDAGAVNVDAFSFMERIQLASYAINLYVLKFFAPFHLSSFYPYPLRPFDLLVSISPIISMAMAGLIVWKFKKNRNIIFGFLFFLISIVLLVQLVTVGSTIISERYTYLAYVGLSISMFFLVERLFNMSKTTQQPSFRNVITIILLALSFASFKRAQVWENGETLWTDAIEKFPEVAGSWGGRGVYFRLEKKYTKAIKDFNQAIALNPNEPMFYSNRGNIYFDLAKNTLALQDYNTCIQLEPDNANALANKGAILGKQGQLQEAQNLISEAIKIDPNYVSAYVNRAIIHGQMNQRILAKKDYHTTLKFQPKSHDIWNALAIEHQYLGEFDSSLIALNLAIELSPEGVYYMNRGISLRLMGEQSAANIDFNQASNLGVEVNPGYYQPIQ